MSASNKKKSNKKLSIIKIMKNVLLALNKMKNKRSYDLNYEACSFYSID